MNTTLHNVLDLMVITSCMATCLRLLFYRRHGSNFKRGVSLLAWLLITVTGSIGMLVITGKLSGADINAVFILLLWLLTVLVFWARGNVAQLLRSAFWMGNF